MSYPTTPSTSSPPSSSSSSFRARLAGIPATTRARPLTFPLGALVGFLLGFSAASLWGYSTLVSSHRALADRTSASLVRLEETRRSVEEELVQRVGRMGVSTDQLEAVNRRVGGRIAGLEEQVGREAVHRERMERRVVGLEEENLELRRRLWRLGKYAKLEQKAAQEQQQQQQAKDLALQMRNQRPYGAVLWTGRSQEGQRLV